jgi:hypothetical protein
VLAREAADRRRGMPQKSATVSGANSRAIARTSSSPFTRPPPRRARRVLVEERVHEREQERGVAPGRMKWCSLASFAVSVRRGSTTTIFPPRAITRFKRPGASGIVIRLPCEIAGSRR